MFIIGTPRSGTTLLKSILCGSREAAFVNYETTAIFQYRDIFSSSYHGHTPKESQKILRSSCDIIDFYQNFINPLLVRRGATIFIDKLYRVDRFLINMIMKHMPNSYFVYISRDGRDCYCSAVDHSNIPQRVSLVSFARYYNKNELIRSRIFANASLSSYMHTKYENLCRDPGEVVASICSSVGMEFEDGMLLPSTYSRVSTLSNTTVHANLSKPIGLGSVSRFKTHIGAKDIALFEKYARRALDELNYEIFTE